MTRTDILMKRGGLIGLYFVGAFLGIALIAARSEESRPVPCVRMDPFPSPSTDTHAPTFGGLSSEPDRRRERGEMCVTPRRDEEQQGWVPISGGGDLIRRGPDRTNGDGASYGTVTLGRDRGLFQIVAIKAGEHGVPVHIAAGLAEDESSWRPYAIGAGGEEGLFQLSTETAQWCGGIDRLVPEANTECAMRSLAARFAKYDNWLLAIADFKGGPDGVHHVPALRLALRAFEKAERYR